MKSYKKKNLFYFTTIRFQRYVKCLNGLLWSQNIRFENKIKVNLSNIIFHFMNYRSHSLYSISEKIN